MARYGHGIETVRKTLMDSCNDAIMQMSYKIGKNHLQSTSPSMDLDRKRELICRERQIPHLDVSGGRYETDRSGNQCIRTEL